MANGNSDLRSVIVWFNSTEQMLADVLDVIPYEAAHAEVWSPRLVTILLEACSQVDSLLMHQATQLSSVTKKKLDITDHFTSFGQHLSEKWVVFWGEEGERISPFKEWHGLSVYDKASYSGHDLPWWKGYNKLKHDRIANRREGKLRYAVEAVAGLFLAILYCDVCRDSLATSGWLACNTGNPTRWLNDHLSPQPAMCVSAETQLFSYPVGWMKTPIPKNQMWNGPASERFRYWFREQGA